MTQERWVSIDDAALLLGTTTGNARLLAHRRKWRRTRIEGRTRYFILDVLATTRRAST